MTPVDVDDLFDELLREHRGVARDGHAEVFEPKDKSFRQLDQA